MKTGIELIAEERQKQIVKHGFTAEHHANHPEWYEQGQLVSAAHMLSDDGIDYFLRSFPPLNWDLNWWQRMCDKPRYERIVIAGALLAAEIDRLKALP